MFTKNKVVISIQDYHPLLIIRAEYKGRCVGNIKCTKDAEKITIGDIQCKKNNRGYGSLMMESLINYAKEQRIELIEGWLSTVDIRYKERLYHFYQKFGFKIIICRDGMKFANIKLKL